MPLLDIALVKRHLRVDWDDEDTEIAAYQAAAETIVTEYLDRVVYAGGTSPGGDAIAITPAISAAVLLVTADLFDDRTPTESTDPAMLPPVVRRLLSPYRVWRTFDEDDDAAS